MVVGAVVAAVGPAILGQAVTAPGGPLQLPRVRSPQVSPGNILGLALQTQALSERGLEPVVSTDPFTGDFVLSTADQSNRLFDILGERFAREAFRATAAESEALFREREAFIERRRQFPVFPGGAPPPAQGVRETVVANLTRVSPQPIAPGVVSSALPSNMSRRLAGPCAGNLTGFQRLNCARGGLS